MKKAVFFDMDGTLWDQHMRIPESAAEAIAKLRENGNYAFISSGRSRAEICTEDFPEVVFDGILCGCGTHIEYQGEILFEELIPYEQLKWLDTFFREKGMPALFEGTTCVYADTEEFQGDRYIEYLKGLIGAQLRNVHELDETSRVNKISALCRQVTKEELAEALSADWHLINHASVVVEVIPKGFTKATGIEWICRHLGIAREDTYAFGDSSNDLDMLKKVAHGIAMGNGTDEAKASASYITTDIHADGIKNGLRHFGLI